MPTKSASSHDASHQYLPRHSCLCKPAYAEYNLRMTKKTTLDTLASQMEKGFAAIAEDISRLATKGDVAALHTQINDIETQLRDMKHTKLHGRVADLEEKV